MFFMRWLDNNNSKKDENEFIIYITIEVRIYHSIEFYRDFFLMEKTIVASASLTYHCSGTI
jgi:hypothetical protein